MQTQESNKLLNFFETSKHRNEVVAAVLTNHGEVALFQRSEDVQGDKGLWHCITGFLSDADDPEQQARTEVSEEASINSELLTLVETSRFVINDKDGEPWVIHAFHYETLTRNIELNWENSNAQWMSLNNVDKSITVDWLSKVMQFLRIENYIGYCDAQ